MSVCLETPVVCSFQRKGANWMYYDTLGILCPLFCEGSRKKTSRSLASSKSPKRVFEMRMFDHGRPGQDWEREPRIKKKKKSKCIERALASFYTREVGMGVFALVVTVFALLMVFTMLGMLFDFLKDWIFGGSMGFLKIMLRIFAGFLRRWCCIL